MNFDFFIDIYRRHVIDRLYKKLRAARTWPLTSENEARYQKLLTRLRVVEVKDAQRLRERLAKTGPLRSGEVDAVLHEVRDVLARYENGPAGGDSP